MRRRLHCRVCTCTPQMAESTWSRKATAILCCKPTYKLYCHILCLHASCSAARTPCCAELMATECCEPSAMICTSAGSRQMVYVMRHLSSRMEPVATSEQPLC